MLYRVVNPSDVVVTVDIDMDAVCIYYRDHVMQGDIVYDFAILHISCV